MSHDHEPHSFHNRGDGMCSQCGGAAGLATHLGQAGASASLKSSGGVEEIEATIKTQPELTAFNSGATITLTLSRRVERKTLDMSKVWLYIGHTERGCASGCCVGRKIVRDVTFIGGAVFSFKLPNMPLRRYGQHTVPLMFTMTDAAGGVPFSRGEITLEFSRLQPLDTVRPCSMSPDTPRHGPLAPPVKDKYSWHEFAPHAEPSFARSVKKLVSGATRTYLLTNDGLVYRCYPEQPDLENPPVARRLNAENLSLGVLQWGGAEYRTETPEPLERMRKLDPWMVENAGQRSLGYLSLRCRCEASLDSGANKSACRAVGDIRHPAPAYFYCLKTHQVRCLDRRCSLRKQMIQPMRAVRVAGTTQEAPFEPMVGEPWSYYTWAPLRKTFIWGDWGIENPNFEKAASPSLIPDYSDPVNPKFAIALGDTKEGDWKEDRQRRLRDKLKSSPATEQQQPLHPWGCHWRAVDLVAHKDRFAVIVKCIEGDAVNEVKCIELVVGKPKHKELVKRTDQCYAVHLPSSLPPLAARPPGDELSQQPNHLVPVSATCTDSGGVVAAVDGAGRTSVYRWNTAESTSDDHPAQQMKNARLPVDTMLSETAGYAYTKLRVAIANSERAALNGVELIDPHDDRSNVIETRLREVKKQMKNELDGINDIKFAEPFLNIVPFAVGVGSELVVDNPWLAEQAERFGVLDFNHATMQPLVPSDAGDEEAAKLNESPGFMERARRKRVAESGARYSTVEQASLDENQVLLEELLEEQRRHLWMTTQLTEEMAELSSRTRSDLQWTSELYNLLEVSQRDKRPTMADIEDRGWDLASCALDVERRVNENCHHLLKKIDVNRARFKNTRAALDSLNAKIELPTIISETIARCEEAASMGGSKHMYLPLPTPAHEPRLWRDLEHLNAQYHDPVAPKPNLDELPFERASQLLLFHLAHCTPRIIPQWFWRAVLSHHESDAQCLDAMHSAIHDLSPQGRAFFRALRQHFVHMVRVEGAGRVDSDHLARAFGPAMMWSRDHVWGRTERLSRVAVIGRKQCTMQFVHFMCRSDPNSASMTMEVSMRDLQRSHLQLCDDLQRMRFEEHLLDSIETEGGGWHEDLFGTGLSDSAAKVKAGAPAGAPAKKKDVDGESGGDGDGEESPEHIKMEELLLTEMLEQLLIKVNRDWSVMSGLVDNRGRSSGAAVETGRTDASDTAGFRGLQAMAELEIESVMQFVTKQSASYPAGHVVKEILFLVENTVAHVREAQRKRSEQLQQTTEMLLHSSARAGRR